VSWFLCIVGNFKHLFQYFLTHSSALKHWWNMGWFDLLSIAWSLKTTNSSIFQRIGISRIRQGHIVNIWKVCNSLHSRHLAPLHWSILLCIPPIDNNHEVSSYWCICRCNTMINQCDHHLARLVVIDDSLMIYLTCWLQVSLQICTQKKLSNLGNKRTATKVSCKIISMPYPNIFQGSCSAILHLTSQTKKCNMDT
jgi:hypothetical protein